MLFIKCMSLFHHFVHFISVLKYTSYWEIMIEVYVENIGLRSVFNCSLAGIVGSNPVVCCLCNGPITQPGESYQVCVCVCVCVSE